MKTIEAFIKEIEGSAELQAALKGLSRQVRGHLPVRLAAHPVKHRDGEAAAGLAIQLEQPRHRFDAAVRFRQDAAAEEQIIFIFRAKRPRIAAAGRLVKHPSVTSLSVFYRAIVVRLLF